MTADDMAAVIVDTVKRGNAPVIDRVSALEAGRERDGAALISIETQSAAAGATLERAIADLQVHVLELQARVRELEAAPAAV